MDFSIKTQTAVLRSLYQIQIKYRRTYSWVRRSTILKLLKKYYGIDICLSTLSYHLWILRKAKIIRVYERYGRASDGTYFNLPSNRQITGKGIYHLKQIGLNVASWLYNWAFKGIKPSLVKHVKDIPQSSTVFTRPPRRAASPPETLGSVLSDFQKSFK